MDDHLTIVLLGNTGVGKSASGNTILGRTAFESRRAFISVTKRISEESGHLFDRRISVIDTPGILCAGSEEHCRRRCQQLLQSVRPCLFLVVVKIDRFTPEQNEAVEAAIRVIGDQGLENCYLLFTSGDVLDNMSLDDFINQEPEGPLPPLVQRFGSRYHVFNNYSGGQEQVRGLLEKWSRLQTREPGPSSQDTLPSFSVPLEKRRIVLLGLPGAGKSSLGNTILGPETFTQGCSFNPVTTRCDSASAMVEGQQVTVVDTPGFSDKRLAPEQLSEEILKTIKKACPGPHAFIFVVRIGRMSEADSHLLKRLPQLFGSDAHKYAMVVFTHGDNLRGQSIDDLIQSDRHVSRLVSTCGHRYCVFDNSQRGNRQQVRNLLSKIDQMVAANGGEHYTSEMLRKAERLMRENKGDSSGQLAKVKVSDSGGKNTPESYWDMFVNFVCQLLEELRAIYKSLTACA